MTEKTPQPFNGQVVQGIVILSLLVFIAFVVAGLGWHVGVALARVLGL